jgi:peptidyl-tRNA hydrolase
MVSSYVLSDFSNEEKNRLKNLFSEISRNIHLLLEDPKQMEAKLNAVVKT